MSKKLGCFFGDCVGVGGVCSVMSNLLGFNMGLMSIILIYTVLSNYLNAVIFKRSLNKITKI